MADVELVMREKAWTKGTIPPHLQDSARRFREAVRQCARETQGLSGRERVREMNACTSRLLRKDRVGQDT